MGLTPAAQEPGTLPMATRMPTSEFAAGHAACGIVAFVPNTLSPFDCVGPVNWKTQPLGQLGNAAPVALFTKVTATLTRTSGIAKGRVGTSD